LNNAGAAPLLAQPTLQSIAAPSCLYFDEYPNKLEVFSLSEAAQGLLLRFETKAATALLRRALGESNPCFRCETAPLNLSRSSSVDGIC